MSDHLLDRFAVEAEVFGDLVDGENRYDTVAHEGAPNTVCSAQVPWFPLCIREWLWIARVCFPVDTVDGLT